MIYRQWTRFVAFRSIIIKLCDDPEGYWCRKMNEKYSSTLRYPSHWFIFGHGYLLQQNNKNWISVVLCYGTTSLYDYLTQRQTCITPLWPFTILFSLMWAWKRTIDKTDSWSWKKKNVLFFLQCYGLYVHFSTGKTWNSYNLPGLLYIKARRKMSGSKGQRHEGKREEERD